MRARRRPGVLGAAAVALAAALAAGPAHGRDGSPGAAPATVRVDELPREARQTLALIAQRGPYPYPQDGSTFGNYGRALPPRPRGYYREYTVRTPGARDRGARRVVTGRGGERWYTDDHYRSFRRIQE